MAVGKSEVRQADADRGQPARKTPAIGDTDPAEHSKEQRRDAELDDERKRGEVPHGAEQDELQRPGLEHRIGESVRPPRRQQLLPTVHEVDEVAGIRPSIEVGRNRGGGEDRRPHTGDRGAQEVPHHGRYRPLEE